MKHTVVKKKFKIGFLDFEGTITKFTKLYALYTFLFFFQVLFLSKSFFLVKVRKVSISSVLITSMNDTDLNDLKVNFIYKKKINNDIQDIKSFGLDCYACRQ
jgi:hypothetical protein